MRQASIDAWPVVAEDRGHSTPCLVWQAGKTTGGYGETWDGRRVLYAHRLAYERAHGPIPKGLQIDHLCRVRSCCNPEHLEAVTVAVNVRRGNAAKLVADDVREIRRLKGIETSRKVATRFGISHWYVKDLWARKYWKDIH